MNIEDIKFSEELKQLLTAVGMQRFKALHNCNTVATRIGDKTINDLEILYLMGFVAGVMTAAHLIIDDKIKVIKKPNNVETNTTAIDKNANTTTEEAELSI